MTTALHSTGAGHGSPEQDANRKTLNDFIRASGGVFDGVADFDRATLDPAHGEMRAEFVPESTTAGRVRSCTRTGRGIRRWRG